MRIYATTLTSEEAALLESEGWVLQHVSGSERYYYWNVANKGWPRDPTTNREIS